MKKIPIDILKTHLDQHGNIFLLDKDERLTLACTIKHGSTIDVENLKSKPVTRVTIFTANGLEDEFFFNQYGLLLFHHLQSQHITPNLSKVYLHYFLDVENLCPDSFFLYVLNQYFKELGFTFPVPSKI